MITGVVKLAPSLPVDGTWPFLHLDRKFMHLGFHIYDVGFQSPNVDAARPMVFATTLLLLVIVVFLNLFAIALRNRLRRTIRDVGGVEPSARTDIMVGRIEVRRALIPPARRASILRDADGRDRAPVALVRRPSSALKDVVMSVPKHRVTAYIGPSGCGKSTLLRCLNRMNDLVDGVRIDRAASASAARTSTIRASTSPSCASGWAWCSRSRTRSRSRSSRTSPTARASSALRHKRGPRGHRGAEPARARRSGTR